MRPVKRNSLHGPFIVGEGDGAGSEGQGLLVFCGKAVNSQVQPTG